MDLKTYLSLERGRASSLAASIGVTPTTVSEWAAGRKSIPSERCAEVEQATHGQVTCEELRPDLVLHWAYLSSRKQKKAPATPAAASHNATP